MTYLEAMKINRPDMEETEILQFFCPSQFFGVRKEPCDTMGGGLRAVPITKEVIRKCRECWLQEVNGSGYPVAFMTKVTNLYDKDYMKEIADAMRDQPLGKKKLAARIAVDILESEQFLEAYPKTTDPERIKKVLTRVLTGNRVSTEDGRKIFKELSESYLEMRSHSDKSIGPSKSDSSQSSQPE